MRIFSTFSGIGGFELGAHAADQTIEFVGYSEIDKYAIKVYEKHFKGVPAYGDITKINAKELPDFDCLVGGFPCQAFSIAGKRRGFEDTRGTLFFDLARILREKQPRYFVFENVKGLLSHDSGNTFRTIIATIDELGYDCQWQVLNSKNFGVPQNRERVYIVGHLRGTPRPEVFPIGNNDRATSDLPGQSTNTLTTRYYGGQANGSYAIESKLDAQSVKIPEATKKGYAEASVGQAINLSVPNSKTRRGRVSDVAPTLDTGMQIHTLQPMVRTENMNGDGFWNGYTGTIRAGASRNNNLLDDTVRIRRLTPKECERLQGFPDDWTSMSTNGAVSDTQRYKMCGNAVTTNVVQAVFERLLR